MSGTDVSRVVSQIEHSQTSPDGHTHNFDGAYRAIVQMQQNDQGPNSAAFRQDMAAVNDQLHAKGLLPNLGIEGVDTNNHSLITRDLADHRNVEQNASSVNDHGALGSGNNPREAADALLAKAFGVNVTRNADGSYDVQNPLSNPKEAAAGIIKTVLNGLLGGDSGSGQDQPPIGMNPLMWQAWKGWGDQPQDPPPPPDPPPPDSGDP